MEAYKCSKREESNRECYPEVNTCSDKVDIEIFSFLKGTMVGKTKIQPSKVQRLDTDIANMTADSLNYRLNNFVGELWKENGQACERSWVPKPQPDQHQGSLIAERKCCLCNGFCLWLCLLG